MVNKLTPHFIHDNITPVFKAFFNNFLDLLFPRNCILCARYLPELEKKACLCAGCQNAIRENYPPFCLTCPRHLQEPTLNFCPDCLKQKPHFDCAWAATFYNDAMKKLIHLYKYGNKTALRHHCLIRTTAT